MELQIINNAPQLMSELTHSDNIRFGLGNKGVEAISTDKPFIQANTISVSFDEVKNEHIIPVYVKDNNTLISHADFIDAVMQMAVEVYEGETILNPSLRV